MKIVKYKRLGSGKYKVTIDDDSYLIYEDIIIKYSILTKKSITKDELNLCLKDNNFYEAYYKGLSYINTKLRTEYELNKYLTKFYDKRIVNKVISRIKEDGYINEDVYTEAYINDQINLKFSGPEKIKRELIKLGVNRSCIDKYLKNYTKEIQCQKMKKFIEKEIRLNNKYSVVILKNKILRALIDKGFYMDDINRCMGKFEFNDDEIYDKEYKNLYNKLSTKYSGSELQYRIKAKMYQKGFKV